MDQILEIRTRAIQGYNPKDNTISDRMQEVKEIAEEMFREVRKSFIEQALDPTIQVLYYEYRNPKRFSGYDSEYIKGRPSKKVLVMILLQEMCKNDAIVFIHDKSNVEGELNWQFLRILPTYSCGSLKQGAVEREKKTS